MKDKVYTSTLAVLAISLFAVLFFTGASNRESGERWSIQAVAGERTGVYLMDQSNGDIYFLDHNPRVASSHARIERLGNISEAR